MGRYFDNPLFFFIVIVTALDYLVGSFRLIFPNSSIILAMGKFLSNITVSLHAHCLYIISEVDVIFGNVQIKEDVT